MGLNDLGWKRVGIVERPRTDKKTRRVLRNRLEGVAPSHSLVIIRTARPIGGPPYRQLGHFGFPFKRAEPPPSSSLD
uniref:Uncharacterized protein n=1 Tax=Vespula pensylvanica TaxID=30213 RepID=A0A834U7F2_VESPE|nr:hypothetical protein H0235_010122 [Vespula pensylvanica]